jgi:hypothetical protein
VKCFEKFTGYNPDFSASLGKEWSIHTLNEELRSSYIKRTKADGKALQERCLSSSEMAILPLKSPFFVLGKMRVDIK